MLFGLNQYHILINITKLYQVLTVVQATFRLLRGEIHG